MIAKLRTYRALPALLAVLLVVSVSMPLVRYACGATGKTVTTLPVASVEVQEGSSDAALCGHGQEHIRAAFCLDAQSLPAGCEEGALCTVGSENRPSALSIEAPSVRLDVAQDLTVARITPLIVFSHRSAFPWSGEAVEAQDRVPIRLRTSTLLL